MLAAEQQELSRRFANRSSTQAEKFDRVGYRFDHGTILLEGCIATLVCDVVEELVHGDHAIVVGEFVHGDAREGEPLIFFRSEFGTLVA
jgi:flavin reductase (DIM6/NTAB) family NADH-FMN oxidoreductase RutF